jgi:hypothetical protein
MADESSETSDESLDATSERFDPLKALYSSKVRLPSSEAPIYDNVAKFENVLKGVSNARTKVRKRQLYHVMSIRARDTTRFLIRIYAKCEKNAEGISHESRIHANCRGNRIPA